MHISFIVFILYEFLKTPLYVLLVKMYSNLLMGLFGPRLESSATNSVLAMKTTR